MPIYEFYCVRCHRIFNFLARSVTSRVPACPRCGHAEMTRRPSRFAVSRGLEEPTDEFADLDDSKLEAAMASIEREMDSIDEDDPRQAARLMRRFAEAGGMPIGEGMEEALRRMEAGEDPEAVEEELGDVLEQDPLGSPPASSRTASLARRLRPPPVDEELYEL